MDNIMLVLLKQGPKMALKKINEALLEYDPVSKSRLNFVSEELKSAIKEYLKEIDGDPNKKNELSNRHLIAEMYLPNLIKKCNLFNNEIERINEINWIKISHNKLESIANNYLGSDYSNTDELNKFLLRYGEDLDAYENALKQTTEVPIENIISAFRYDVNNDSDILSREVLRLKELKKIRDTIKDLEKKIVLPTPGIVEKAHLIANEYFNVLNDSSKSQNLNEIYATYGPPLDDILEELKTKPLKTTEPYKAKPLFESSAIEATAH